MSRDIHRSARSAALISASALALAACGSSGSSATTARPAQPATPAAARTGPAAAATGVVATQLTEFKIASKPDAVAAGRVTFNVTNSGRIKHQFTVIRTSKSAATVLSHANPNDDIPGAVGEIVSLAPGTTRTLVIKHLKPGHYAFVCALPGHYQAGMREDFTVN